MQCVIVGSAAIKDYKRIKNYFTEDDYYIFCDGGLNHLEELSVKPDLIVGDFDSYHGNVEGMDIDEENIIRLPREKDDTDTMFAVKEGIRRGFDNFLFIGVLGERFDHSLVNLSALLYLDDENKHAKIVDDYCEMEVVSKEAFVSDSYSYFSLINLFGEENEISISDAKYSLEKKSITPRYQYGVSNEVLPKKKAKITLHKGRVLLIRDF